MYYKEELKRIYQEISERAEFLREELEYLPEGELFIREKDGQQYYCERMPKAGNRKKEKRTGITNDEEKILSLVRKKYVKKALQNAEADLHRLKKCIDGYQAFDEISLMKEFAEKYPGLSDGIYHGLQSNKEWAESYAESHMAPESFRMKYQDSLKSTSASGIRMRSMGELYIGSRLDSYGIAYVFEAKLGIPDLSFIPDFTILRPRDGRIIYWEHFGMPTEKEYMEDNLHKLRMYSEYGIVPWRNLIITYNTENGGVDGRLIDAMIHGWLL